MVVARPDAGFTLVELLVCLVLIAVIMGLALPRFSLERPDTLERRAAAVAAELARLRLDAMGEGAVRSLSSEALRQRLPDPYSLSSAEPPEIVFFPNGSSNGAVWELAAGGRVVAIAVDWLTGRISLDGG